MVFILGFFFFKQKTAYEMQRGLVGSEMCIRDRVSTQSTWAFSNLSTSKHQKYKQQVKTIELNNWRGAKLSGKDIVDKIKQIQCGDGVFLRIEAFREAFIAYLMQLFIQEYALVKN
eukprot:TRINITY_DN25827_c0_g1_i1.p1 TRINITY_DN25827_c0_g1~~TRINITY_DN25827_c0_g1_i1.p1  ORF type:complete len:116 (-),score=36.28 TRINITY_DN25827_c0_g1_i1:276-623(-)